MRSAIALACRAPSVHNSQPWTWRYDAHNVHLLADLDRLLPATDVRGRDLVVSCAPPCTTCVSTGGVRRRDDGQQDAPPRGDRPARHGGTDRPSGEADVDAAGTITRRRTDRRRYGDWPVPEAFLDELHTCAEREGAVLHVVDRSGGGREMCSPAPTSTRRTGCGRP